MRALVDCYANAKWFHSAFTNTYIYPSTGWMELTMTSNAIYGECPSFPIRRGELKSKLTTQPSATGDFSSEG
ncbi:hypothetical protein D910_06585 [Dendroctonus ponderosae]|uniref:Uncharacterized protein n=1 Tax=Dendroctonus ponderosae TaxID=77166 RepID=U4UF35_DENPD|nr:hypothetical protein D910_06585 [Dendroctonus ponderosae]